MEAMGPRELTRELDRSHDRHGGQRQTDGERESQKGGRRLSLARERVESTVGGEGNWPY